MVGYRKIIALAIGVIAEFLVLYKGVTVPEELQNQLLTVIMQLIGYLAIPGTVGGYLIANVKAKQVMAANGGAGTSKAVATPATTLGIPPADALAASLGAPLDIEGMLIESESNRDRFFNYKFANTKETGLYYAFRDLGNATATASMQHCQEFFDALIELAQASWLAETEKVLGKGKGFSWDDKELPENLAKGYSPGCHALSSYSWARKFSLSGHYRGIATDIDAAAWLELIAEQYPHLNLVTTFGANSTLYRVGVNAREVFESHKKK